jgi:hypothetical protein
LNQLYLFLHPSLLREKSKSTLHQHLEQRPNSKKFHSNLVLKISSQAAAFRKISTPLPQSDANGKSDPNR